MIEEVEQMRMTENFAARKRQKKTTFVAHFGHQIQNFIRREIRPVGAWAALIPVEVVTVQAPEVASQCSLDANAKRDALAKSELMHFADQRQVVSA